MLIATEGLDLKRIFIGDASLLLIAEVIIRTVILFAYTVLHIRYIGKRGIGQFSILEMGVIILFGSAVGDTLLQPGLPLINGMVCISVMTLVQVGMERFINHNRKIERVVEGEEDILVKNGHILLEALNKNNISHADLFRALRLKDVEHLGEVRMAVFETSGQVTVFFQPPRRVRPGLTTMPEEEIPADKSSKTGDEITITGHYSCLNCGDTLIFKKGGIFPFCPDCHHEKWIRSGIV